MANLLQLYKRKELRKVSVDPRTVLVTKYCTIHPNVDDFVSKDGNVIAKFFLPKVTALFNQWIKLFWFSSNGVIEGRYLGDASS